MAPPSPSAASLLGATLELAGLIGKVALGHYRGGISVECKPDGSPVTIADREAERSARAWLDRHFPTDAVLGEEFGEQAGTSGRTWVLDPIDGTRTFVRGVPLWGSLVAVVDGDAVLAGAAAFPAVGETVGAALGEGCWHNGSRCTVSEIDRVVASALLTSDPQSFATPEQQSGWDRLARQASIVRTWGDCYGYLLVATGRAEIMIDARLNPWDIACFVPIVSEAGGRITDLAGGTSWRQTSAIATNAGVAAETRRIFGVHGTS